MIFKRWRVFFRTRRNCRRTEVLRDTAIDPFKNIPLSLHLYPSLNQLPNLSLMSTAKTKVSHTPSKTKASIIIKLKQLASKEPNFLMTLNKIQDAHFSFLMKKVGCKISMSSQNHKNVSANKPLKILCVTLPKKCLYLLFEFLNYNSRIQV